MQLEIGLAREHFKEIGHPVLDQPVEFRLNDIQTAALRKNVRLATDALITEGIEKQELTAEERLKAIADGISNIMMAVAGTCVSVGVEPQAQDLLCAARELICDARIVVDRGLLAQEWDQVLVGAVMLEIVCRGVAACLGLAYEDVVNETLRP